jgi:hypothetical protein
MSDTCPDCGAKTGEQHKPGCDVERCPSCGYQALQCLHNHGKKVFCENTGDEVRDEELLPWTGEWPGEAEAREYGFWCKMSHGGWVECSKDDPEAKPSLNRVYEECVWDRKQHKFVLKG